MRAAASLLALAIAASANAAEPNELTAHGRPLGLSFQPVDVPAKTLGPGVALHAAIEITADDPDFGGVSGLLIEGERLTAITDRAHWITARFEPGSDTPLAGAAIAPMLDEEGIAFTGENRIDAEGLARIGGALMVSFEREHRIARHIGGGRLEPIFRPDIADELPSNGGIEALAAGADGRLLAITEGRLRGGFPWWMIGGGEVVATGTLPPVGKQDVTGAELGLDGRLYVVQRHWSFGEGTTIRVLSYATEPYGSPDPLSFVEIASYAPDSGIDNMEGIAMGTAEDGRLVLWMISDDNFSRHQRTLLIGLSLAQ